MNTKELEATFKGNTPSPYWNYIQLEEKNDGERVFTLTKDGSQSGISQYDWDKLIAARDGIDSMNYDFLKVHLGRNF